MSFLRAFALVLGLGLVLIAGAWWFRETFHASPPIPKVAPAPRQPGLLGRQPELVARAVEGLRPQRAGRIDLYTLGFAGDGTERVFRNEVEYFAKLMAVRFDAAGRTLSLMNSAETSALVPLATLENLRATLQGVGARMDVEEDVLVLFLTSHGSREHELSVKRPPLRLAQLRPGDLRAALDAAGIRWRVLIVSACYSGGFVDELRGPRTLVVTAARRDRTSFGCGSDSEITWFGDAYLARALNQTTDFELAFSEADRLIREWEKQDGSTPSEPQLSSGERIGPKLEAWRAAAKPGPPLPFVVR